MFDFHVFGNVRTLSAIGIGAIGKNGIRGKKGKFGEVKMNSSRKRRYSSQK